MCLVWRNETSPDVKVYVTLKTSFIQATHFQCCHNHLKSMYDRV